MARFLALALVCLLTACGGSVDGEPDDDKQTIEPVLCLTHDTNPSCAQ